MSGLQERLQRLKGAARPASPVKLQQAAEESRPWPDGRVVSNALGSFILRERRYPLSARHGRCRIGDFAVRAGELAVMMADGRGYGAERFFFFDTETTGLGVGAGNVPFMIGCGYFADEQFVVEQLLMRSPAEEPAMLVYLQDKLRAYAVLVTYNGRTFDWPVLNNRYVLNRLERPAPDIRQLDLLYGSRGLWKHTMESCRLGRVEEEKLGIARSGDVPGAMAPVVYLQYLASGDSGLLLDVFRHNEADVLSLVALADHFCMLLSGRADYRAMSPAESFRAGLWLDKYGRSRAAAEIFHYLTDMDDRALREVMLPLAAHLKKNGDYAAAAGMWERWAQDVGEGGRLFVPIEPYIELAMFYEHKRRDVDTALQYAEQALAAARRKSAFSRGSADRGRLDAIDGRIARLRRKQSAGLPCLF